MESENWKFGILISYLVKDILITIIYKTNIDLKHKNLNILVVIIKVRNKNHWNLNILYKTNFYYGK